MSKSTPKNKPTKKQYEELGQIVSNIFETGYLDANKSYRMSFIKGLFQGLGGAIGATLLVAVLIWLLSVIGEVPFLNRLSENIQQTVQTTQQN